MGTVRGSLALHGPAPAAPEAAARGCLSRGLRERRENRPHRDLALRRRALWLLEEASSRCDASGQAGRAAALDADAADLALGLGRLTHAGRIARRRLALRPPHDAAVRLLAVLREIHHARAALDGLLGDRGYRDHPRRPGPCTNCRLPTVGMEDVCYSCGWVVPAGCYEHEADRTPAWVWVELLGPVGGPRP